MEQQNQQPIQEDSNVNRDFQPPKKSLFANKRLYLFIVLVAVVLTVGGILLLRIMQSAQVEPRSVTPQTTPGLRQQETETSDYGEEQNKVVDYLRENITSIVQVEPVLGAPRFFISGKVEFYEGNKFIAPFEDGHIGGYLLSEYSIENGEVRIVYLGETLNQEEVDELKKKHGFIDIDIDTSTWQTYRNDEFGFELQYPSGGKVIKTSYGPRIMLLLAEEGTNLSEKYLDIAIDGPSAHIGGLVSSEQVSLGGNLFMKEIRGGAAAGNIYDTESYLINYEGRKYNLSFTLHSGNIGNYDPSIRPKEFNKDQEKKVFNQILSTFRFIE